MRAADAGIALACAALCGCSTVSAPPLGPAVAPLGVPTTGFDPRLAVSAAPSREPLRLPDTLQIPAEYRLILLDGQLALVRETGTEAARPGHGSLRIVAGEAARPDPSYQPALLPQELAAEVAANRESSARMDNALASVMQRSRDLADQASALEAQGKRLGDLLEAAEARIRELEAARRPAPGAQGP